ncbi:TPA: YlbF family regulator [Streptococcus equi subsp. zooepidemicus]|nr:YlbF family regulator [Streptococcus equi subsp. zooepidemicus]HEL0593168.1 YlbF family regulator [Streptococcus equi subsp. zooepidemicus]HEL0686360.1 YlbF family regulator [Streptococcus equi subsp. zooepidemicus]HEL1060030.1 YlbF family regulator [Streptococcus equi subsp. zooepidemicus]
MPYRESLHQLIAALEKHSSIIAYKEAQQHLLQRTDYNQKAYQMKRHQQDTYLFRQIAKDKAAEESAFKAQQLRDDLDHQPLIDDYRDKMQNASDLVRYITGTIEDELNKEFNDGKD